MLLVWMLLLECLKIANSCIYFYDKADLRYDEVLDNLYIPDTQTLGK